MIFGDSLQGILEERGVLIPASEFTDRGRMNPDGQIDHATV